MTIDLFILLLTGFMLIAGLIAVEANDLLSAVIAVGAAGFALSVVDLLLGAPDLAFPQVLVEVITLVLLIRMVMTRRDTSRQSAISSAARSMPASSDRFPMKYSGGSVVCDGSARVRNNLQ